MQRSSTMRKNRWGAYVCFFLFYAAKEGRKRQSVVYEALESDDFAYYYGKLAVYCA